MLKLRQPNKKGGGVFINTRIKQLRKDNMLTLAEFGQRIGITASSCSSIERGQNNPSNQTVITICREFRVNEKWLRTGEGPKEARVHDENASLIESILKDDGSQLYRMIRKTLDVYLSLDEDSKKVFNAVLERVAKENESQE